MHTILIVDDSAVERRLAGGLLQASTDYELLYAENGSEALGLIAQSRPSVVITDLVMPGMDGLELVQAIRCTYPQIPVILMTAFGNEVTAARALREGAVSYVPKSMRTTSLVSTIRQVLERANAVQEQHKLAQCLDRLECSYVLDNDPALIKPLVDLVENALANVGLTDETEHIRVGVALEEALYNALYHGNLSVNGASYAEARESGETERFTALAVEQAPDTDRCITFKMSVSRDGAEFVIRDEGEGCQKILRQEESDTPDDFETGRNRGLKLMWHLMDDVRYNEAGNEVKLSLHKRELAE